MGEKKGIILAGAGIGIVSVILVYFGNPLNMGACIACFIRDIAGGVGLHRAEVVQYIRPEALGIVLGGFLIAISKGEFKAKGGSAPLVRFILGFMMMVGALIFLGCPLRMILRIAGGDLNSLFAIPGFVIGIYIGIWFLNNGFNLKRNYTMDKFEGYVFPAVNLGLLFLLVAIPSILFFSEGGPGAMRAPIWMALAAGLFIGVVSQRTRLCTAGAIRDFIMFKDTYLLAGFLSIFVLATLGNLVFGFYNLGFEGQPVAHTQGLWNFGGMLIVGWAAVLLGGCPLRQLILSAEGNIDSVITSLGMAVGAAFAHNFGMASSPAGASLNGRVAVGIMIVVLLLISYAYKEKDMDVKMKGDAKIETN